MIQPNYPLLRKAGLILGALLLLGAVGTTFTYQQQASRDTNGDKEDIQSPSHTNEDSNHKSVSMPVGYPLSIKKEPSSLYGWRIDPFTYQTKRHQGVDFSVPAGTLIKATGDGKVIQSSYDQANGQFIEIDHNNGYRTKYAHLKTLYVSQGQAIQMEQTIGEVGSTGRSTSAHLHYEVTHQGTNINPLNVMGQSTPQLLMANDKKLTQENSTSKSNMRRVLFIRNSGTEYRMVDMTKPQQF